MKDRILNPLKSIPRSTFTPKALADASGEALKAIRTAAKAVDDGVAVINSNADLSDPGKARKRGELRRRFVEENEAGWTELREYGELARLLLDAYYTNAAIRSRLLLENPDVTAALLAIVTSQAVEALYQTAIEAGRTYDPLLAAVVLGEVTRRVEADQIGPGDAEAIARIAEAVPLPALELEARSALEAAVVAGLEGDQVYRSTSSGQPATPIQRLQLERTIQTVRGVTERNEPADDSGRLRRELDRKKAKATE